MQSMGLPARAQRLMLALIICLLGWPSLTGASPAQLCDQAARTISAETGVPLDVLRALTRAETGRGLAGQLQPWPWTVNIDGSGIWFDTEAQARQHVFRHFRQGARNFDIGCFQINYRWHGQAFGSIEEMFDPMANARYAARFLLTLHAELGDWTAAVGRYHSRTPAQRDRYLDRYADVRAALDQTAPAALPPKPNGFPLLQGVAAHGRAGSLVPLTKGSGRSLLAPARGG